MELGRKLRKRLEHLAAITPQGYAPSGLAFPPYYGSLYEEAPSQYARLEDLGFVTRVIPHNSVHKERVVITDEGREFLREGPQV